AFSEGTLATTTQSDGAPDTVVAKDRVNGSETSYTPSGLGDTVAPVGIDDAGTALLMFTLQDTLGPDYYLVDLSAETPERLGLRIDGTTYAPVDVAQLSADGKFVAFQSRDDGLVDGDTNGDPDVFLYDVAAQETTRLSVTQSGTQGASASELGGVGAD